MYIHQRQKNSFFAYTFVRMSTHTCLRVTYTYTLKTRKLSHRRHKTLCSTVKIWIESLGTAKSASLLKLRRAHAFTRRQLRIQQNNFSSWTHHTARSRYYCISLRRVVDFTLRHRVVCSVRQWREWQGISIQLRSMSRLAARRWTCTSLTHALRSCLSPSLPRSPCLPPLSLFYCT